MVVAPIHRVQSLGLQSLVARQGRCQGACSAVLPMTRAGSSIGCDFGFALVPERTAGLLTVDNLREWLAGDSVLYILGTEAFVKSRYTAGIVHMLLLGALIAGIALLLSVGVDCSAQAAAVAQCAGTWAHAYLRTVRHRERYRIFLNLHEKPSP